MKYRSLFSVSLEHDYYADGKCPDFDVAPLEETRRLVKNHRALLRTSAAGLEVLVPVDTNGRAFLEFAPETEFVFCLRLVNPAFATFTQLESIMELAAPVFSNVASDDSAEDLLPISRNRYPRLPTGVFAMAGIRHRSPPGPLPATPFRYRIRFTARRAHWSFYCVSNMPGERGDLAIVDLGNGEAGQELVFGTNNRKDLSAEPDPSDRIATELAKRFPELRRMRFVSDTAIACRETPRKRLELQLEGQRLLGPLQNPAWSDSTVIGAGEGQRETFYNVVKHRIRPLNESRG